MPPLFLLQQLSNDFIEGQRALLREMRPQARFLIIERRDNMLHPVYGEVHAGMEHSQSAVHHEDTAGEQQGRRWRRNVLGVMVEMDWEDNDIV